MNVETNKETINTVNTVQPGTDDIEPEHPAMHNNFEEE